MKPKIKNSIISSKRDLDQNLFNYLITFLGPVAVIKIAISVILIESRNLSRVTAACQSDIQKHVALISFETQFRALGIKVNKILLYFVYIS